MDGQHSDIAPLSALSDAERARALERYGVIQPCVEHNVPLTQVAHHHGLPLRTVQRWLARYRHAGLAGLARRGRSDRGQQRGLHAELKQVIEGFALRTPPPPWRLSTAKCVRWHANTAGPCLPTPLSIGS